jgi:KDO2-lipid IV(A) lauroyltransferase
MFWMPGSRMISWQLLKPYKIMKQINDKTFFQAFSDHFTQGSMTTAIAVRLSQRFPPSVGYPAGKFIATVLANRFYSPLVKAVRLNQWIAHDRKMTRRELNQAVYQVFAHQAHSLYNFYRNLDNPDKIQEMVKIHPSMQQVMDSSNQPGGKGTMLLIPHMSGFDLGGLLLARMGFKYLTLSYPNPPRGYEWQNKLRNDRGEEVVPLSFQSTQAARERLQAGGTVLTGVDRPYPGAGYFPTFFGEKTEMPVAYIKLAMKAKARVFVIGFLTTPAMTYEIEASEEIDLGSNADPRQELEENASRVLGACEGFIRRNPASWAMFYPVWPQLVSELP